MFIKAGELKIGKAIIFLVAVLVVHNFFGFERTPQPLGHFKAVDENEPELICAGILLPDAQGHVAVGCPYEAAAPIPGGFTGRVQNRLITGPRATRFGRSFQMGRSPVEGGLADNANGVSIFHNPILRNYQGEVKTFLEGLR